MRQQWCHSNFGPFVIDYWRVHYPELTGDLEKHGNLFKFADSIADKAAEDFARVTQSGVQAEFAYDFSSRILRDIPGPARKPAVVELKPKPQKAGQS